jgi:hypothetical protein
MSLRAAISPMSMALLTRVAFIWARKTIKVQSELALYLIVAYANTDRLDSGVTTITTEIRLVKASRMRIYGQEREDDRTRTS